MTNNRKALGHLRTIPLILSLLMTIVLMIGFSRTAYARGTTSYVYDAQGRVTRITRSGVQTNPTMGYIYDAADNPSSLTVRWAPRKVIVLPLSGGAIIALSH